MFALFALIGASLSVGSATTCASQLPASRRTASPTQLELLANTLVAQRGKIRWNGKIVTESQLAGYLRAAANLSPVPPLTIQLDYKDCTFARSMEKQIKASTLCSLGTCYLESPR